jgi:L-cysteine/cystine lyase
VATVESVATDPKVEAVRAAMPAARREGYFNAGTNGPLPAAVIETLVAAARREYEQGRIGPGLYEGLKEDWQRARERIASIFGADADEIALTRSTTDGVNIALHGLDWEPGDEIVTTSLEHPGIVTPLALLAHRYGVVIRVADIGDGGGDVVGAIAAKLTSRTRVVALSHVMWSTGAVIRLREVADLAHEHEALVVVDAAQAAGQVPVDLHALDVDAYALSGQKWLCGPGGTGALYVRRDRLADFKPTYLRMAMTDPTGYLLPAKGAARYEIGEFYNPEILGQLAGLAWLQDEVGLDWAYDRIAALGRRCFDGLNAINGVTLVTPRQRMAGLVCFTLDGMHPREVMDALDEKGYIIRYVENAPGPTVARVSTGWWCTEEEVDGFVAAVAEIATEARAGAR